MSYLDPTPADGARETTGVGHTTDGVRLVKLLRVDEDRGSLCATELGRDLPFPVARAYWIFGVPPATRRAGQAHRHQQAMLIAVKGAFTVHCDDGHTRSEHRLDSPDIALVLAPMVFHHVDGYLEDSICLVLSSAAYDPDGYIRDYGEFLAAMGTTGA